MTLLLGIETSCDETAGAVVRDGHLMLSNVVASQVDIHRRFGGVVPEVASRQHLLEIIPVVSLALSNAGVGWEDIEGVAVTNGPGLAGSLLVGVSTAKAIAWARGIPLVGVNHLEGHIYANWLHGPDAPPPAPPLFPLVCLIVSGGHSDLIVMEEHGRYRRLGRTRDDAAGEAFDKAARILGLGYPGGPVIQRAAGAAFPSTRKLPRAWLRGTDDFSFSGLKTAMLHLAQEEGLWPPGDVPLGEDIVADLAAAFQEAVADVLVTKTVAAARKHGGRQIMLAGGVAANARLRELMLERSPLPVLLPDPKLCTDNAAMIAACGYHHLRAGRAAGPDLDVLPSLKLA